MRWLPGAAYRAVVVVQFCVGEHRSERDRRRAARISDMGRPGHLRHAGLRRRPRVGNCGSSQHGPVGNRSHGAGVGHVLRNGPLRRTGDPSAIASGCIVRNSQRFRRSGQHRRLSDHTAGGSAKAEGQQEGQQTRARSGCRRRWSGSRPGTASWPSLRSFRLLMRRDVSGITG